MNSPPKNSSDSLDIRGGGFKSSLISFLLSHCIRMITKTLHLEVTEEHPLSQHSDPVIFCLWHNRIFSLPYLRRSHLSSRTNITVLTSASKDGAILEKTVRSFGLEAVRGSSSRRAVVALIALKKALKQGSDITITPDGPRGPRYQIQPGALKLAMLTGAPIIPVRVHYHRYWRLDTWDQFRIPKPFSKVSIIFCAPQIIEEQSDLEEHIRVLTQSLETD